MTMRSNVWVDDATFLTLAQSMNECIFSQSCAITPIPKIAHFIWLGSNRLPDYAELFIARFRSLHPHWRVIVWDDSAADSFPWAKNKAFFDESSNWGMKSDILRYEILYAMGGVYVDVDYEVLRPLDCLADRCSFFASFANTPALEISNAIIGASPSHPVLERVIGAIDKRLTSHKQSFTALARTNPVVLFLSEVEQRNLLEATRGLSYFDQVIADTGPGMLTQVIDQFLRVGSEEAKKEAQMLLLPCPILNPVPNCSNVSIPRQLMPSEIGTGTSMVLPAFDLRRMAQNLYLHGNAHACVQGDYEQVKMACQQLAQQWGHAPLAIHWWQRSWQT